MSRPTALFAPEPDKANLQELLRYLGLEKTAAAYSDLLAQAQKNNWSHEQFLEAVVNQEAAAYFVDVEQSFRRHAEQVKRSMASSG